MSSSSVALSHVPLRIEQPDFLIPDVLRDQLIDIHTPAAVGLDVDYTHDPGSVIDPSIKIDYVNIRGPLACGIRLRNAWNASLVDCFVNGVRDQQTHAQLTNATMRAGIDCGGSMDVHVVRPRITCARTGIYVEDTHLGGQGEGVHVSQGWIMHAVDGVHLNGFGSGGWPTPNAWVSQTHLCITGHGLRAYRWSGIHITDNDFYGSQLDSLPWGIYLAECRDVVISQNRFWHNRPVGMFAGAIVLDNCHNVVIDNDNVFSPGLSIGLWATNSCTGIQYSSAAIPAFVHDLSQ